MIGIKRVPVTVSSLEIHAKTTEFSGRGPPEPLYRELTEYLNPPIQVPVHINHKYRKKMQVKLPPTGLMLNTMDTTLSNLILGVPQYIQDETNKRKTKHEKA